jgi:endonuclease/exonuclease/phosphatase family metal-dependent hydrolase
MAELTVVTYNIHGGRQRAPLAAVVASLRPDVLVVNEAPRMPVLWRWKCERLAREWGLRRVTGGRDGGQNLLCVSSRVQVLSASARRLRQPLRAPMRGLVTAQCAVDGVEFGVTGVHLSLVRARREAEAGAAVAAAAGLRGPVVVCGDLNEPPGGPAWQIFRAAGYGDFGRPDDLTFSSTNRRKRIDAVLVKGADVLSYGVPELPSAYLRASDHCPVRAVLRLSRD